MPVTVVAPRYFRGRAALERWFLRHAGTANELVIGFWKVGSGRASVTRPESVDVALCHGWIDGIVRRVDEDRYTVRFTPGRKGSIWSAVNLRRIAELEVEGRVTPAGLAALRQRDPRRAGLYSFERPPAALEPEHERQLRANRAAWAFFERQAPSYRRTALHWVTSARRPETRQRRLDALIADSAGGRRIKPLRRRGDPGYGA